MAIRKVSIKIRIKNSLGKRPYENPVWETGYGSKWEFVGQETDRVMARRIE
jgi:hypothetical protein